MVNKNTITNAAFLVLTIFLAGFTIPFTNASKVEGDWSYQSTENSPSEKPEFMRLKNGEMVNDSGTITGSYKVDGDSIRIHRKLLPNSDRVFTLAFEGEKMFWKTPKGDVVTFTRIRK